MYLHNPKNVQFRNQAVGLHFYGVLQGKGYVPRQVLRYKYLTMKLILTQWALLGQELKLLRFVQPTKYIHCLHFYIHYTCK